MSDDPTRPIEPFRILVVCTGNICRSPTAELLLRSRLGAGVVVSSAGTRAAVGDPVHPLTELALRRLRLTGAGHAGRQLTAAHVAGADLVLGLTREHRASAVRLHPPAAARAYTMIEFARLATEAVRSVPGTRGRPSALLEETRALRGVVRSATANADDVGDPISGPAALHEAVVATIVDQTGRIAAVFGR